MGCILAMGGHGDSPDMKSKIRGIHGTFTLALTFTPYLDSSQTIASGGVT
jgi:hypothetical protein